MGEFFVGFVFFGLREWFDRESAEIDLLEIGSFQFSSWGEEREQSIRRKNRGFALLPLTLGFLFSASCLSSLQVFTCPGSSVDTYLLKKITFTTLPKLTDNIEEPAEQQR